MTAKRNIVNRKNYKPGLNSRGLPLGNNRDVTAIPGTDYWCIMHKVPLRVCDGETSRLTTQEERIAHVSS